MGMYPSSIEADVSPARLQRFFVPKDGGWQVTAELRQQVLFARHDLLADPPFTRLHLASCRNALIYFDDASRAIAVANIRAQLNPGGFVCLGHSESMSRISDQFSLRRFPDAIVYQKPGTSA